VVETVELKGVEPTFEVSIQPTTVTEGETINLSCTASGQQHFITVYQYLIFH